MFRDGKYRAIVVDLDDVLFYTNPIFKKAAEMNLSGDDLWKFFHEKVKNPECGGIRNFWCRWWGSNPHV